jgi:type IV pilus assembly protein PilA
MFCPKCGGQVADDAASCPACRQLLATFGMAMQESRATPGGSAIATSGKAIASLVLGLLSFIFLAAIPAVIFGHLALSDIKKSAGRLQGSGMAIAGLVLGYLGIAFIPIMLVLFAIAIPNLLRARIAANEAAAVHAVRTMNMVELSYQSMHKDIGFTCSLDNLRDDGLLEPQLAAGTRYGYIFVLQGCAEGSGGANSRYQILAYPANQNQSGVRAFCSDESNEIKFDATGSASNCIENGALVQ